MQVLDIQVEEEKWKNIKNILPPNSEAVTRTFRNVERLQTEDFLPNFKNRENTKFHFR